jgi:hypothetical protein
MSEEFPDDDAGRGAATKVITGILMTLLIEKGVDRQEIVSRLAAAADDLAMQQGHLTEAGIKEIERVIALLGGRTNASPPAG